MNVITTNRRKPSLPLEIIEVEFALSLILVDQLFQTILFILRIHKQSPNRLSQREFQVSRQPHELGDRISWCSHTIPWFDEYNLIFVTCLFLNTIRMDI